MVKRRKENSWGTVSYTLFRAIHAGGASLSPLLRHLIATFQRDSPR